MSVSADGATAVSVAADGCAMVWDVQSGSCRHTLKGPAAALHWVYSATDSSTVLTVAGNRMVKAWDSNTGACTATLPSTPMFPCVSCFQMRACCLALTSELAKTCLRIFLI